MLKSIIKAFAGMQERSGGVPLVYLDSAATTQKPQSVIDAIVNYYKGPQGNVHRSTHQVASAVGAMVGAVRRQVGDFLGGAAYEEVIFTPGTTASLNLVAQAYGHANLAPGDEVLVSAMEHHSNYLPWHILCEKTGAQLRVIPIQEEGILDQKAYGELLSPRTKLVALTYVSNVLGFVNPLQKMIAQAHAYHAVVVVDAAQAVP
ncbi:MAG: aminotransferase class V-fold PLP-dependent enzyme, partial [Cytophagales bacterium]